MKLINKIITIIEEYVLAYSVIFMALLLIANIIMRKLFNHSMTFSEEVGQSLLIIVSFFGLAYTAKKGRHITMSILFDAVNNKKKKIMMFLISLVSSIIMFYLAYLAFDYVLSTINLGRVTPALRIPIWMIYTFVPLGMLLTAIEYLFTFILNIKSKEFLYLTSEIRIPMDADLKVDLNTLIELAEKEEIKGGKK